MPSCSDSMPGAAYTPRWECVSMTPGVTHFPFASITTASAGALTVCPTAAILPFCRSSDPRFDRRSGGRQNRRIADDRRLRRTVTGRSTHTGSGSLPRRRAPVARVAAQRGGPGQTRRKRASADEHASIGLRKRHIVCRTQSPAPVAGDERLGNNRPRRRICDDWSGRSSDSRLRRYSAAITAPGIGAQADAKKQPPPPPEKKQATMSAKPVMVAAQ